MTDDRATEPDPVLLTIAVLLADQRSRDIDQDDLKTEVLLASAGVPLATIARVLGKKHDTVRKAISRAAIPELGRDG